VRRRVDQRQSFLVSSIVHLLFLMIVVSRPPRPGRPIQELTPEERERRQVVVLPPASVLRQLIPPRPRPATPPAQRPPQAAPTPPPPGLKDRISVGPPSDLRSKGPMILRKEDDLTKAPKGRPDGSPSPPSERQVPATPPPEASQARAASSGGPETPERPGLRLPPGLGNTPSGQEGRRGKVGPEEPPITSSLRSFEKSLRNAGNLGIPTGTGQQMGPLFFDPQGADFTAWINHFKDEVYRNWIVPQPALMGFKGHVEIEFSVERDGTMTGLRMVRSAGTTALDRAAQNALIGSRFMQLPADFGPPRVTMHVTFFYNEGPSES
jgi:periplasmic protein TonB